MAAGYVPPLECNRSRAFRGIRRDIKLVNLQSVLDKFPFLRGKVDEPGDPETAEVGGSGGVTPPSQSGTAASGIQDGVVASEKSESDAVGEKTTSASKSTLTKSDSSTSLVRRRRKKKLKSRRAAKGDNDDETPQSDVDDASSVTSESSEHSVKLRKKARRRRRSQCPVHAKSKRNSRTFSADEESGAPIICTFEGRGVTLPAPEGQQNRPVAQHPETGETMADDVTDDATRPTTELVCTCRKAHKLKCSTRPEPEGGQPTSAVNFDLISEFDKIIYNTEPLFSDLENDPDVDEQIKQESERHHKRNNGTSIFSAAQMINTNTMMKFAIIQTELKNTNSALRRVIVSYSDCYYILLCTVGGLSWVCRITSTYLFLQSICYICVCVYVLYVCMPFVLHMQQVIPFYMARVINIATQNISRLTDTVAMNIVKYKLT